MNNEDWEDLACSTDLWSVEISASHIINYSYELCDKWSIPNLV
jgi:hypothetical protein